MSRAEILGRWYCHTVDQEQSEEEEEEFGEYDDYREPQKASKTEHAQTVIELREDGTYELTGSDDYMTSRGTWTLDGGDFELTEVEPAGGYEQLEYVSYRGDRLIIAYKLIPDAHDGLDVLVLTFTRDEPVARGPKPEGLVERFAVAEDEDELWEALDEALDEQERPADEVARELWDAVVEGKLLVEDGSERYDAQASVLGDERLQEPGGFTHAHALHLLPKMRPRQHDLADLLADLIGTLPPDPRDEELAALMGDDWVREFARLRFLGGGTPEALYRRPLFPQPQMDDACREQLRAGSEFTRFESIAHLLPPGHPDTAGVVIRYRGRGLLETPLALIRERELQSQARAAALEALADEKAMRSLSRRQSACIFALVLSIELGEPVPEIVFTTLSQEAKGMMTGSMNADERKTVKGLIADLPQEQRELVTERLFLDKA